MEKPFLVGDRVWHDSMGLEDFGLIYEIDEKTEVLYIFLNTPEGKRTKEEIPFQGTEVIGRGSGIETSSVDPRASGAIDRFTKRFLDHAKRPGGTKPGHVVTEETAREVARGCAARALNGRKG